ncbi:hypothetical protein K439DRAFT_1331326 [Ramaria rubella]|nr:hypothetical protein K439DRAFT_1331326 [Ramaria rubella]
MDGWKLDLSTQWDVLGPFPISAREQHFISPAFPINLALPYHHEPNRTWPSSLADGGSVGWKVFNVTDNGRLVVSHPDIRWKSLRATEGWAALQHHNVLHTTLRIIPPAQSSRLQVPWLACSFLQASFFALMPVQPTELPFTPEWNPGDIYGLPRPPKQLIEPPALSLTEPTSYHLFVSGDYEIRLFGDPEVTGHQAPVLDIHVNITLESRQSTVVLDPALHVVCDFVQGWAFGSALGIGIRAMEGQWEVQDVFALSLLEKQRLAPSQTRVLPIIVEQRQSFHESTLHLSVTLLNLQNSRRIVLTPTVDIRHLKSWDDLTSYKAIQATYFLSHFPTVYVAIPPALPNLATPKPPIIALHGAGVDILDDFWPASLTRQPHSWIVCPAGRTSWASCIHTTFHLTSSGFDWHGPSADDVWGSLVALTSLLASKPQWAEWTLRENSRAVVIGHSNGGQGTWYLAARYPDRVLAAIPAAAYIKSQQYIPWILSRGAHFLDPSHGGILAASLAQDDNDLFLSNVVNTKILAIHGGDDENVPTWHSRELVGLVRSLRNDANIRSFAEDPGKPHWYPDVLSSPRVQSFLSSVLGEDPVPDKLFTLTVAIPSASGSFHGFAIQDLKVPGRLGKITVSPKDNFLSIKTSNVYSFSFNYSRYPQRPDISIDGMGIKLHSEDSVLWFQCAEKTSWTISSPVPSIRPTGPVTRILSSVSPLKIITPSADRHADSIARRLAHAMLLYLRLDTEIFTDLEVGPVDLQASDLVVIGSNNTFGHSVLQSGPGIVKISPLNFTVNNEKFSDASRGIMFLHPHPFNSERMALFLCGNSMDGLERIARLLLPMRTGVPLPDFLITGQEGDHMGIGGLHGGG